MSEEYIKVLENLLTWFGLILGACILLGLAIAAIRALLAWKADQRDSFVKYRNDSARILAVGVVAAMLVVGGSNGVGRKLYNFFLNGSNSEIGGNASTSGAASLKPSSEGWTVAKGVKRETNNSGKTEREQRSDAESEADQNGGGEGNSITDSNALVTYLIQQNVNSTSEFKSKYENDESFRNTVQGYGVNNPDTEELKNLLDSSLNESNSNSGFTLLTWDDILKVPGILKKNYGLDKDIQWKLLG